VGKRREHWNDKASAGQSRRQVRKAVERLAHSEALVRRRQLRDFVWHRIVFESKRTRKAYRCEGQQFEHHICDEPLDLHEVIYPRSVFQKLDASKHDYFWSAVNCTIVCRWFHKNRGETPEFRDWFLARMANEYGAQAVVDWVEGAPLKIKEKVRWLLPPGGQDVGVGPGDPQVDVPQDVLADVQSPAPVRGDTDDLAVR